MLVVDAHLDLAYNVTRGRDVTRPAAEQPVVEGEIATVGLPDLKEGNVGLICATIFAAPATPACPGYTNPEEARTAALVQLDWYKQQQDAGRMKFVHRPQDLPTADAPWATQHAILLLEGADPIRAPGDVTDWFAAGLRIVGLAWRQTRYAGGTGAPGPLTNDGVTLVRELDRFGIIHDASHLAEQAFWQLLDLSEGPVIASHSNCRAIVPTDRQLSNEMIRALVSRGGVIGINFYDKFLLPTAEYKTRRATLADVVRHAQHVCDLAGSAANVAIGTDLDGGLGREQIPEEIRTAADLPRVAEALSAGGFSDEAVRQIMAGNWLRFFRRNLAGK